MRYIRRIKILLILLLPILIYTFAFPYINTNELKAEEVTLEGFDDSPSGNVKITQTSKISTDIGGAETYAFLDELGQVYVATTKDVGVFKTRLGGGDNPMIKDNVVKVESPDSTDSNRKFLTGIDEIDCINTSTHGFIAKDYDTNKFYLWGDVASTIFPDGTRFGGIVSRPKELIDPIDENIIDVISFSAYFYIITNDNLYQTNPSGKAQKIQLPNNPITGEQEKISKVFIHNMKNRHWNRELGIFLMESGYTYFWHGGVKIKLIDKDDGSPFIATDDFHVKFYPLGNYLTSYIYQTENSIKKVYHPTIDYNLYYEGFYTNNTLHMKYSEISNSVDLMNNNNVFADSDPTYGYYIYFDEQLADAIYNDKFVEISFQTDGNDFDNFTYMLDDYNIYQRTFTGNTNYGKTPDDLDYFHAETIPITIEGIPKGYKNIAGLNYYRNSSLLLSNTGAVFLNGVKINFYGDVSMSGKKVNDNNKEYASAEKYNDHVEINIKKTDGIDRGKLYYKLDNGTEQEITSEFNDTITVNEGEHIKKTYKGYIKSVDTNAVLSDSEMTFVVDVYKKDISVTGIENNKSYNSVTISWDENNGIADNPITVTMTKDGSEYSYTKGAELNEQGSYTLTATDTYGNTKTYAFSILGPDDPLGLIFTKNSSGTLEYDNTITKANAQIGTVSLEYGEDASTTGTIDLTSTSISAGNDDGYFSIDGDQLKVEKDLPAGTYTITIDGSDSNGVAFSFPVEIVIAQKEIAISLSISDITYGETLSIGADEVSGLPTGFTPTIEMKSEGEAIGSYTDGVFTPSKVGTATFGVSVNDPAGNYTFTCTDQTITVKPKSVTLSLTQSIVKYAGESLANVTPAASDNYTITPALLNGDTLSGTATYAYVSGSDATDSGETIKVKITGLSNDNYSITETATELSVTAGDEIKEGWYTITGTKNTGFDWYASDVSVAIDTSKSGSYNLISKDGDFTGATSSFVLNTDETHNLSIQMKDGVSGRLTQTKDEVIKIDRVTPAFTIVGNAGKQSVTSGVETKGPVVLSGSLTSTNASTISYYYTTVASDASSSPVNDSSKWTLITDGGLTASKEGSTTYYMKAVSGAGLVSDVQEFTTVINNDVTTPSSIAWSDGLSEQELIYGASLSLQISGLQNEEVAYSIIEGDASKVTIHTDTHTLTANSGTGTIKVQAKIKGYKEPLVKTITLKKKELTVKTQISNKDTISIDLHGTLPQTGEFGIVSSDLVNGDTISLLSSVTYEYRDDDGSVITPVTSAKGTYKLYAKITSSLDNYTIKTIVPAIVTIGGDITYTELHVKAEYLKNGAYVPYTSGTWVNQEIRFTLQGGIQDVNKITGYEYIISSTKPNMNDPKWTSISDGTKMTHTVTQASHNATYWFRVTPYTEGAKLSKQTTINLDLVNPEPPVLIIKEKPRNALEKALNAMSFNSWFKQEVEVSFTSSDQDSGVKEIVYEERTDKGSTSHTISYGTTITYAADTTLYLKAKAIDHAGNTSTFGKEEPLAIDMSVPTIKGVKDQKEYKQYYVPRFVTVTDSGSGLKQATYQKDNSSKQPFTENVEEKIKGEGRYEIYAIDEAGNETTLTFKIVSLPDIKTEIDGSDESKEIIDQIIKELEEVKDKIDQNEKENYDKWIEDATDQWNDLRMKVVEDQETTSKVEGQGDTTFDPKTELIVEEIPKDQVPVLPKHAIKTYDVYLMKGEEPVQPDGSVKVYLPYEESEPPIVYEIGEDGRVTQLSVKQEGGYVTFVTTVLKKYAISNTAQSDTSGDHNPTPDDPSQNDQQCVVGPDGKLETADDVCAGGNGEDQPVKKPDGSITVPEGGVIIFPDQEVPAPDGAIINPDGSVDFPDGSHYDPDGNKTKDPDKEPDPNPNPDDGKGDDKPNPNPDDQDPDINNPDTNNPDDHLCTAGPDGISDTSDDVCGTPNDKDEKPVINPDGSITIPDGGSVIFPDGSEVELPDGGIINPDGTVELPDGTIINPDGTKKDPEKPKRECKIKGIKLNVDSDTDGLPDLNLDIDDDCVADLNIDMDNDSIPDLNIDTTGNGTPDLNIDSNTDGIADLNVKILTTWTPNFNTNVNGFAYDTMTGIKADLNVDTDGDGIADVNIDSDGDGIADTNVIGGQAQGSTTNSIGGTNTADTTKWKIWMLMVVITIITMIYSIVRKCKRI